MMRSAQNSHVEFAFLICSERSGSNLITSLLNGHSAICAPPPSHLFRLFLTNTENYGDLDRDENWAILLGDMVDAFDNQLGQWTTQPSVDLLAAALPQRGTAEPLRYIYEIEARDHGKSHVFVKENQTAVFAEQLADNFDGCKFIMMVRDPRDVAASYLMSDGIQGGVATAADTWVRDQTANINLQDRWRDTNRVHLVRYETLITDPMVVLEGVVQFLDLQYESAMLDFHRDRQIQRNAAGVEAWANLNRPILSGNAGKYVQSLTPDEAEFVELRCFDLMARFGYRPDIVQERPEEGYRKQRLEELRPRVREGRYRLRSAAERERRRRRLRIIDTVLARRLP